MMVYIVWNANCVDILPPSHLSVSVMGDGNVAASAKALKRCKYEKLGTSYIFAWFGVETFNKQSLQRNL